MKNISRSALLIFLLIAQAPAARADEGDAFSFFDEEAQVVTASRRSQKITESPSAISVITAEDIRLMGARSVAEALNLLPGVDLRFTNQNAFGGGIRGAEQIYANKIVLMIDGRSWTVDFYTAPALDMLPVTLEDISRIEVLRGAGSSLYGSGAIYGVINIITKQAKDAQGAYVNTVAGTQNYYQGSARYGGAAGANTQYRISADALTIGRYAGGATALRTAPGVNARVDHKLKNGALLGFDGSYRRSQTEAFFSSTDLAVAGVKYTAGGFMVNGDFQYKTGQTSEMFHNVLFTTNRAALDVQQSFEPAENNKLLIGADVIQLNVSASQLGGNRKNTTLAGFVEDSHRFENIIINGGMRIDRYPQMPDVISHRTGATYSFNDDHSLRFTWGRAFRNPDLTETYVNSEIDIGIGVQIPINGNTGLKAESAQTYELGYQGRLNSDINMSANMFYTKFKNPIILHAVSYLPAPFDSVPTAVRADNLGRGAQYGAEVEFRAKLSEYLTGLANYTYMGSEILDGVTKRNLGDTTPRHIANAQLRGRFRNGFGANAWVRYRGVSNWDNSTAEPRSNPSATLNVRIGYEFDFYGGKAEAGLAAYNVTNHPVNEMPGYDHSMRRVTADLTYRF
ncbi:MAG: hypothetical protein A2X34_02075 [Elusimicrobia bacterium GWC2_51_8]|nr:MAG: hypothetical protein A2X33_07135 [Elusimicrobia bacterium GWA2_51_34]OGR60043.1 MAG: hypothetical protein A2X34_02075 [Elusimicrobia bacterium GWC2_51_8]HAF95326.1 hypothetical protein [Elusimicrobiota bacterium]HCE96902.1 hypothetical protein [Elusimicrobiota bacterium]